MENPIKMDDLGVSLFLETPTKEEKPPVDGQILHCTTWDGQRFEYINQRISVP